MFHGFDTLGSHLREEGSLGYDGGLVRLQVQTKLDAYFNRQHMGTNGKLGMERKLCFGKIIGWAMLVWLYSFGICI
jgi:hypothetical protein